MGKKKELMKNTIIIFISKFCTQFLSFFLLPLYTALLSTNEYGTYDLIVTYLSLLAPIITIQLENSMFRFLIDVRDDDSEKQKIISVIFKIILSIIVILLLLSFIIFRFITIKYVDLIILNMIGCIFVNLLLQVARGLGKNKVFAIASSICGMTTLFLNILFIIVFKMKVDGLLISMLLANLISSIYLFIRLKLYRYLNLNVKDKSLAKSLVKYSLPLIPNNISWWIINVSDRTIISLVLSVASNGIYAISNKFSTLYMGIYNVFGLSFTESAAKHVNDNDKDEYYSLVINKAIIYFAQIIIVMLLILPLIYSILINQKYIDSYVYVPILLLASLFHVILNLYGSIYIANKKTKQIMQTSIYAAVINIIINLLFIKFIGLYAASLSTLLAYFFMTIYRYIDIKKYAIIKYDYKNLLLNFLLMITIVISYYINIFSLNIIMCLVAFIFLIILDYKDIKNIYKYGFKAIKCRFDKNKK